VTARRHGSHLGDFGGASAIAAFCLLRLIGLITNAVFCQRVSVAFNAPLASVLLAVELHLFEWRPRSLIPVVSSVTVATICRWALLGSGPVFPVTGVAHIEAGVLALTLRGLR